MWLTATFLAAGGAPPLVAEQGAHRANRDERAARAASAKLLEFADQVRAIVPLSALSLPEDRASGLDRERRARLRNALVDSVALVGLLGFDDAADAHDLAVAILEAPGPLNRKALAPALRAVHERMADVFRHRAAETVGRTHDEARESAIKAAAAMREIEEALGLLGMEKPN
ncbi:MAG: hypothetical protein EXR72_10355 [Myxococcales bacterium]|nr:hypothetical protein [Myxococcales bacterium]